MGLVKRAIMRVRREVMQEFLDLCTRCVNPTDAEILEGFLIRLRKTLHADISSVIIKFGITIVLLIGFFLLITEQPIAELLLAILPFIIMCLAVYVIALIGVVLKYRGNSEKIRKALSEPKDLKCCPDEYVLKKVSSSIDSVDEDIRSAYFHKRSGSDEDLIHVAIHNDGFLFDDLVLGGCYRIYSINDSLVCIVLVAEGN